MLITVEIEKSNHKNHSIIGNIKFYTLSLLNYVNSKYVITDVNPEQIGSINARVYSNCLNEIFEACFKYAFVFLSTLFCLRYGLTKRFAKNHKQTTPKAQPAINTPKIKQQNHLAYCLLNKINLLFPLQKLATKPTAHIIKASKRMLANIMDKKFMLSQIFTITIVENINPDVAQKAKDAIKLINVEPINVD